MSWTRRGCLCDMAWCKEVDVDGRSSLACMGAYKGAFAAGGSVHGWLYGRAAACAEGNGKKKACGLGILVLDHGFVGERTGLACYRLAICRSLLCMASRLFARGKSSIGAGNRLEQYRR